MDVFVGTPQAAPSDLSHYAGYQGYPVAPLLLRTDSYHPLVATSLTKKPLLGKRIQIDLIYRDNIGNNEHIHVNLILHRYHVAILYQLLVIHGKQIHIIIHIKCSPCKDAVMVTADDKGLR